MTRTRRERAADEMWERIDETVATMTVVRRKAIRYGIAWGLLIGFPLGWFLASLR